MDTVLKKLIDKTNGCCLGVAQVNAKRIAGRLEAIKFCIEYNVCPNCAKEGLTHSVKGLTEVTNICIYQCPSCNWEYGTEIDA